MRRLFNALWALITTVYRVIVILTLLVAGVLIYGAFSGVKPGKVPSNVALVIAPSGQVVDRSSSDPTQRFLEDLTGEMPSQTLLRDLTDALDAARTDDRIRMAVLKLDGMWGLGQAQARELASAVAKFRKSGKPVYAHEAFYPQTHYLVAAHADELSLDPMGGIWIEGFSSYQNYFKDALEKLGVSVNVFRVGEYKSAVEPFLRADMSEEARQANLEWLGDLWRAYTTDVEIALSAVPRVIENYVQVLADVDSDYDGNSAQMALDAGLVARIETRDAFRKRMAADVGIDDTHGSFRQIHHADYLSVVRREGRTGNSGASAQVALVVVEGDIVDGGGDEGHADASLIVDLLDEARRSTEVKAVLLRVNSPGGSAFASEKIRRAVQRIRADGTPVVVSMGNLAASGGYWLAMDADRIYAHQATITGSIGIFGLLPTFEKSLEKIGVHTDGVGTTALAGSIRADRALSDAAKHIIQQEIEFGYRQFIEGVAAGRGISAERVDEIARGRVWSGADALELGLVDALGGLDDALKGAAELAGLGDGSYALREFREEHMLPFQFLRIFSTSVRLPWLAGAVQELRQFTALKSLVSKRFGWLSDPRGVYAHCLCNGAPANGG